MRLFLLCACLCLLPLEAWAGGLRVKGNKITYGEREVMLQGVAVGDPLIAREGRPLSDYELIAYDWNANVVRISIHPGTWRDFGRRRTLEVLRQNVDAALRSGLFVIIVWQAIGVPNTYTQVAPDGAVSDLYDTDFTLAKDFWREVGKEFGQDGRIMFELWNEPVWPEHDDGSPNTVAGWRKLKPHWETLTGLVRFYSGNIIILSSGAWGYNLRGIKSSPLRDTNIAYAWHVYSGTDGNDPQAWERNLDNLQKTAPVIVTEWGFESEKKEKIFGTAEKYGYLFADRFIREKELHHTAWCWHPVWTPRMLQPDWRGLTAYGHFIKEILWRTGKDRLVRP